MSRKPIIAGNWKMNLTVAEGLALAAEIRNRCGRFRDVEVVIAPPATALWAIVQRNGDSSIGVAAQNCHWAEKGAYTGELSPAQLAEVGCRYVIIGHSERRQLFGETDEGVGKKARALHDQGLTPIVCVGETLAERERGATAEVVLRQLAAALAPLSAAEVRASVIAYEPVWAIGTGRTATPAQAQEVHASVRSWLASKFDGETAGATRVQYGGSVAPGNVAELMAQPDIDGALVGGASLTAESFAQIVGYKDSTAR